MAEERTYYYSHNGKQIPDEENMIAYLLDESAVCLSGVETPEGLQATLIINVNDYFVPAADAETFPCGDIPKLYELYKEKGHHGIMEYVANKRGVENISWRTKYENRNLG